MSENPFQSPDTTSSPHASAEPAPPRRSWIDRIAGRKAGEERGTWLLRTAAEFCLVLVLIALNSAAQSLRQRAAKPDVARPSMSYVAGSLTCPAALLVPAGLFYFLYRRRVARQAASEVAR